MESLPDDVLLAVLSLVPRRQVLLRCRAVCRRWRSLAVHPDLWRRHRQQGDKDGLLRAVLLLAPCSAGLFLDDRTLERVGMELASTNCAVAQLHVEFRTEQQGTLLALAIRNQGVLGRLRTLTVALCTSCEELGRKRLVGDILCEVVRLKGLQSLDVNWMRWPLSLARARPALPSRLQASLPARLVPSSLRVIEYRSVHHGPEPHLAFLLASHASTLTEVTLNHLQWPSGLPAALFSSMRNLRRLKIPLLQDMHLLRCRRLRSLGLYPGFGEAGVDADTEGAIQNAEAFFREATSLAELRLLRWRGGAHHAYLLRLLRALASSGRAKLQELVVCEELFQTPHDFTYLADLRRLESLLFWEDDDGTGTAPELFWDCLASRALPSLRLVKAFTTPDCLHAFLHRAETQDVWRKNPQLHFVTYNSCCFEDSPCDTCDETVDAECHPGVEAEGGYVGICGHPPGQDPACTVVDHSDRSFDAWFRLPEDQD